MKNFLKNIKSANGTYDLTKDTQYISEVAKVIKNELQVFNISELSLILECLVDVMNEKKELENVQNT